jgi:hypothetical protein
MPVGRSALSRRLINKIASRKGALLHSRSCDLAKLYEDTKLLIQTAGKLIVRRDRLALHNTLLLDGGQDADPDFTSALAV